MSMPIDWQALQFMEGPWTVGPYATDIWAPSKKGGITKICDIRAWGYLTGKGHGALGLSNGEAMAIQRANATLIAGAPDMLAALAHTEAVMTIVAPRSHMKEYLEGLERVRAAMLKATTVESA